MARSLQKHLCISNSLQLQPQPRSCKSSSKSHSGHMSSSTKKSITLFCIGSLPPAWLRTSAPCVRRYPLLLPVPHQAFPCHKITHRTLLSTFISSHLFWALKLARVFPAAHFGAAPLQSPGNVWNPTLHEHSPSQYLEQILHIQQIWPGFSFPSVNTHRYLSRRTLPLPHKATI